MRLHCRRDRAARKLQFLERSPGAGFKFGFLIGLFLLFSLCANPVFSDTVNYIYDNLGRLVMTVSSSGAVVVYDYDQAGNLISATRTTTNNQPPVLTGITPSQSFIGTEISITLTGSNLLMTKAVKSDNTAIRINNYSSTDNSVNIDAQIPNTASAGPVTFTVQTLFGSANISLNLINVTFTPAQIILVNGASASVMARIGGLTSDYNLVLTNKNPDVISAPKSVTVPVAGSASFVINAVSMGTGAITAGNSGISVYVGSAYTGPISPNSKAISVKIGQQVQGPANSSPVSVNITSIIQAPENSLPVSVNITPSIQAPANSLPVSASIISNVTAPFSSHPVSAGIGNATGY